MLRLDARDIQTLSMLSLEGREPTAQLARRVNLSATPCWQRVQKLGQAGVISGHHAAVQLGRAFSSVTMFVTIGLVDQKPATEQAFEHHIQDIPNVIGCWSIGGQVDYLLQVITRDVPDYQALMEALLGAGIGIQSYFSHLVLNDVKTPSSHAMVALMATWSMDEV